jgi:integrase
MAHRKTSKRSKARTMLRLADLEQSKNAVLHSLGAASSQESYGHAIDEFIGWYCSEPRLAFNRTVVLRYRFFLEQKNLAPSTINVRLAAVRRLAGAAAKRADIKNLAPHDLRRTCARLCYLAGGELEQIQFLLGHASVQTTERYLGCKQKLGQAVNDNLGLEDT